MERFELAWAAGFFDGEGWANAVRQEGRATSRPQARINQADPSGVPEVLLRFQRAVGGLGRIGGPLVMEGRVDLYRWEVSSRADVELLHHLLLPWLGQVKLDEFARALGRPAARSRPADADLTWLAWAAGLYDGGGSVYLRNHRSRAGYRFAELCVTQSGVAVQGPEVLRRLHAVLRVGNLNGPYERPAPHMPVWRIKSSARAHVESAIATLWPWLGHVKRSQAEAVFSVTRDQDALPRGNPAWGNRKTHCVNGHEYATARLRPYVPRGEKGRPPRDNHHCLVCVREQARERRRKQRSAVDGDRRSR